MTTLTVQISFFNPIRIVPWQHRNDRKTDRVYMRGGSYARWHKEPDGSGRPYITGTLVLSALFAELENIIALGHDPYGSGSPEL